MLLLEVIQSLRPFGFCRHDFLIKNDVLALEIRFTDIEVKLLLNQLINYLITVHPGSKTYFSGDVLLKNGGLRGFKRIDFYDLL